jgi:hypothetical protein
VGIFLLPLIFPVFLRGNKRAWARVSLGMAALYIGLCSWNHSRALSLTEDFAREMGLRAVRMASLPQPLSPFYWGNYVMTEDRIYRGYVNLLADEDRPWKSNPAGFLERSRSRYRSAAQIQYDAFRRFDDSPWVEKAVELEGAKRFFWFARFPLVHDQGLVGGKHRVEMFDLRFGSPGGRKPFQYIVEFDENGKVTFQGFVRSGK